MDSQKLKIIIAEDEFIVAMDIKRHLEEMGLEVTSLASTALEAITKTETDKPDIIIMDVLLSGFLNGIEAAKIIGYKSKVPIIFLTDDSEGKIFSQANLNINFELLRKPVSYNNLSTAIKNIILKSESFINNLSQPPSLTF